MEKLTGSPLAGDAWVAALQKSTADKVSQEKAAYEAALKKGPAIPSGVILSPSERTGVLFPAAVQRGIASDPGPCVVCPTVLAPLSPGVRE